MSMVDKVRNNVVDFDNVPKVEIESLVFNGEISQKINKCRKTS